IAFYHFRNPQLSPSVKDLIVKQEFSSKKSLTSCEGLLYKRQASAGFCCLPSKAGKPVHLKENGVTLTKGKTIRMARASLANGGV
uniref:hypothetical protein n=1 Tax=Vibrio vulnificus TaxID=672 RepID=UPI001A92C631